MSTKLLWIAMAVGLLAVAAPADFLGTNGIVGTSSATIEVYCLGFYVRAPGPDIIVVCPVGAIAG